MQQSGFFAAHAAEVSFNILYPLQKLKTQIPTINVKLKLDLKNIYTGKKIFTEFEAVKPCHNCKGKGIDPEGVITWSACNGWRGLGDVVVVNRGWVVCEGKLGKELKTLEVEVEKGVGDDHVYEFAGKGHEYLQGYKGGVRVEVGMKKCKGWERQGNDLVIERSVTLWESLWGVMVDVRHLDGTRYLVKSRDGQVVKNGMYTMIGLGMPIYGKEGEFGNLFIKFDVKFPEKIEWSEKMSILNVFKNQLPKNIGY
jgi:DnaJ family protein A protein 2